MWTQGCQSFSSFKRSQKPKFGNRVSRLSNGDNSFKRKCSAPVDHVTSDGWILPACLGDSGDRVGEKRRKLVLHSGNWEAGVSWGVPIGGFPMKCTITHPPTWTQETKLKTNVVFFLSTFYFLFLSFWKSWLNTHNFGWCYFGKLRGKQ